MGIVLVEVGGEYEGLVLVWVGGFGLGGWCHQGMCGLCEELVVMCRVIFRQVCVDVDVGFGGCVCVCVNGDRWGWCR